MYRRFLNNNDYFSIITEEAFAQLIRGKQYKVPQAEQFAEASIIDYLSDNYEIEQELNKGKFIAEYSRMVSYPAGSHFYFDGEVCAAAKAINGYKAPLASPYWVEYDGSDVEISQTENYSQMKNYLVGELVNFGGKVWTCAISNGYDLADVRIPGVTAWKEKEFVDWSAGGEYNLWDVVRHENHFFALISTDGYDSFEDPMTSDCWGMIGDYDSNIDTYELSEHEYVVYQGKVYYPILNPNADTPQMKVNIYPDDPRNFNLKKYMVRLALYELHKLISPNNISSTRIDDYEHSMLWLKDASKLRLNPQIPRKLDHQQKPVTEWQMATFQSDYNPYENPWHI